MPFRNPQVPLRGSGRVYPYRSRLRWLAFGRYSHLVRALRDHPLSVQDTVLEQRVASLRGWNSVRFTLYLLLAPSFGTAVTSAYVNRLPSAPAVVDGIVAFSAALATFLGIAIIAVTRLLGQLEIDILTLLTVEHRK